MQALESRSVPAVFDFLFLNADASLIVNQTDPADGGIDFVDDGTTLTIEDASTSVNLDVTAVNNTTYNLHPATRGVSIISNSASDPRT